MRRRHSKIIAVFLLLVFSQKGGLRLWMHHLLHEARTSSSCPERETGKVQLACDCFSDAMLPLLESEMVILPAPRQNAIELAAAPQPLAPATEEVYYSLKGPPDFPFCS